MSRYKLKEKCLFVDAHDFDAPKGPKRLPKEIPHPHILDQSAKSHLKLNDTAGFIARFVVMGVDTNLIPQIMLSEYRGTMPKLFKGNKAKVEAAAKAAVKSVVGLLKPYLKLRTLADCKQPYEGPQNLGIGRHAGGYQLDFGVHSTVGAQFKLPPPPPPPKIVT